MKKNFLKIAIPVVILALIVTIYTTRSSFTKGTDIEMQGKEDIVRVSLNMNTGYHNELIVLLITEGLEPPSQVLVDILVKDKSIYTNKLEKEENDNFPHAGRYKDNFDSIKDLEKNYKDISVSVTFNEQSFLIPLTSIEIFE